MFGIEEALTSAGSKKSPAVVGIVFDLGQGSESTGSRYRTSQQPVVTVQEAVIPPLDSEHLDASKGRDLDDSQDRRIHPRRIPTRSKHSKSLHGGGSGIRTFSG
jgi:hypothetical protein